MRNIAWSVHSKLCFSPPSFQIVVTPRPLSTYTTSSNVILKGGTEPPAGTSVMRASETPS